MANQNGNMYGLTILSPIIDDPKIKISHDTALRTYLQKMHRHERSPFAKVSGTHICRLVVMDDVVFVGNPAKEEHLKSKYLVFNSNLYGGLDAYLEEMARKIPDVVAISGRIASDTRAPIRRRSPPTCGSARSRLPFTSPTSTTRT